MLNIRDIRLFAAAVLALGFFAVTGSHEALAQDATSCTSTSGYSYSACGSDAAKAGATVIGAVTANAAVSQTVGLISARVSQFSRVA